VDEGEERLEEGADLSFCLFHHLLFGKEHEKELDIVKVHKDLCC